MRILLFFLSLIFLFSCTQENTQKVEQEVDQSELIDSTSEGDENYKLIKDDLYIDNEGYLYLRAVNNEDYDEQGNLFPKDVWLSTVYCDSCWTPTENGWTDITKLNDFVDAKTWRYDTSNGYWTEYVDYQYRYHHTHMADGGTISITKRKK